MRWPTLAAGTPPGSGRGSGGPASMPKPVSASARAKLLRAARRAAAAAYAPYSKFPVGAAVLTGSGRIFTGANVENASFGLCTCAERAAIAAAASAGERRLAAVAVYTPTRAPTLPCGACRQLIHEFGPEALVLAACAAKTVLETRLPALLPAAFGPEDLGRPPPS